MLNALNWPRSLQVPGIVNFWLTMVANIKHHSTETALLYIHDHLVSAIGSQKISCLCLLDLSAAFDTTDHDILITRLSSWFGIHGPVLSWFKSYLSSRPFCVKRVTDLSSWHTSSCGVPKALSLVHCSSSCTPLLLAPSFPLSSKELRLRI